MLNLQQRQSLQQKLSPQQIQYIKLLQLPTLALEQRIKTELEINPLLEEGEEEEELEANDEQQETEPDEPTNEAEEAAAEAEAEAEAAEDDFDWEDYLNSSEDLYGYKAQVDASDEEDDREMPMPSKTTTTEHVKNQVPYLDLDESDELIAEQIIGSIDEDGYLRRSADSIIDDLVFQLRRDGRGSRRGESAEARANT